MCHSMLGEVHRPVQGTANRHTASSLLLDVLPCTRLPFPLQCTNQWLEQAKASLEEEKMQREALLSRQVSAFWRPS